MPLRFSTRAVFDTTRSRSDDLPSQRGDFVWSVECREAGGRRSGTRTWPGDSPPVGSRRSRRYHVVELRRSSSALSPTSLCPNQTTTTGLFELGGRAFRRTVEPRRRHCNRRCCLAAAPAARMPELVCYVRAGAVPMFLCRLQFFRRCGYIGQDGVGHRGLDARPPTGLPLCR